jgi:hypothetical protein
MWGWLVAVIFGLYLLPHVLVSLLPTQDLKKKVRPAMFGGHCRSTARRLTRLAAQYGASWALVTGASSGA